MKFSLSLILLLVPLFSSAAELVTPVHPWDCKVDGDNQRLMYVGVSSVTETAEGVELVLMPIMVACENENMLLTGPVGKNSVVGLTDKGPGAAVEAHLQKRMNSAQSNIELVLRLPGRSELFAAGPSHRFVLSIGFWLTYKFYVDVTQTAPDQPLTVKVQSL